MKFSKEEYIILWQALNEICNGFSLENFEYKIGITEEELNKYFELLKANKEKVQNENQLELEDNKFEVLNNVLEECDQYFEDWEFSTRMGCSREELRTLKEKIKTYLLNQNPR